MTFTEGIFDTVVVGAGHAGCEAALACARTGLKTAVLTLNLDSIAFMACNPSVGGTAKGHLVREIDALGGEMGANADKTALQMRMLNVGKGAAVQSLRCQSDKNAYHAEMKRTLENTPDLHIIQAEAAEILTRDGAVTGVRTVYGGIFYCKAVILATGVYLNAETVCGEVRKSSGPNGFAPASALTENLIKLGYKVRRFKTGTPARLDGRTIDYSECEMQRGDDDILPFSYMTKKPVKNTMPCYLTYTNSATHDIILSNLDRSPLYNGAILSTGPRYCPSIETKVVRFKDKQRHQLFLEPEGKDTSEVYVQGMSTSLPHDIQRAMYRTIAGLEHCDIMRYGYAIEYDCIDTLDIYPTLEFKKISGLYTAGQINGTSGYEEAAAQGLMAGLNASLKIRGKDPLILGRDTAYIGVMIDDLVTKGTDEPYRIMTSRAEHRLEIRQDNADFRLTETGYRCGLVTKKRYNRYLKRKQEYERALEFFETRIPHTDADNFLRSIGLDGTENSVTYADLIRRGAHIEQIKSCFALPGFEDGSAEQSAVIYIKYGGYLKKGLKQIERAKKLEEKKLPNDIDYSSISGLRLEAREKLSAVRPVSLGQASRIPGVNPADIAVLMVYLSLGKKEP